MACQYSFFIPTTYYEDFAISGIKIFEAAYTEIGSTVSYDTSALDSCNDAACLAASMEIAFPSIPPDFWYVDDFSQTLAGGKVAEELQSISIVDVGGNMEVLPAMAYGCDESIPTYSGSTAATFMTFEDLTDGATVEVMITFSLFFGAFLY